jgi:catechol 2,3-dioxygenase-like lactoylglutathione lyase family enzyme
MTRISRRNLVRGGMGLAVLASSDAAGAATPGFRTPQVNLYSRDLPRAVSFYQQFGFVETFRTPEKGPIDHIELKLDGFTLGIATFEAATATHKLHPGGEGHWAEIVVRTDDANKAVKDLVAKGAPLISAPHDFAGGKIRAGWIADPDGNSIQIYQRR